MNIKKTKPFWMTWISIKEWFISLGIAMVMFLVMGTITALWENPFFIRMTSIHLWDFVILSIESLLIGFFLGIRTSPCAIKKASVGGSLGFLGFACPTCNKILVLLFGAGFLLTYFEPIRLYVGVAGILLFSYALYRKLSRKISA
jgi:hypothetical protein